MSQDTAGHAAHAEHHVVPLRIYYLVFGALMVLTLVTVGAAQVDLGQPEVPYLNVRIPMNVIVALLIAFTKATLVALFFMHVKYSGQLIWLVVGGAFAWLAVLIGVTLMDYMSRGWLGNPGT